jgi:hypothetical protein
MDLRGYIDVTEIDPRLLVQAAYSGSIPKGLGFLHHRDGGLDEETLNEIIRRSEEGAMGTPRRGEINLDYVHGRAMKFHVRVQDGRRFIDIDWFDHGREATKHLVRECQLPDVEARIAKAEAEKAELAREHQARLEKGARFLIGILAEKGGRARRDEEPLDGAHRLRDGDPALEAMYYGVERALEHGWITVSEDCREYTLTQAGRSLLSVAA